MCDEVHVFKDLDSGKWRIILYRRRTAANCLREEWTSLEDARKAAKVASAAAVFWAEIPKPKVTL